MCFVALVVRAIQLILAQYSQKISVSEKMLMHMPSNMAFETAAGIPEV